MASRDFALLRGKVSPPNIWRRKVEEILYPHFSFLTPRGVTDKKLVPPGGGGAARRPSGPTESEANTVPVVLREFSVQIFPSERVLPDVAPSGVYRREARVSTRRTAGERRLEILILDFSLYLRTSEVPVK